MHRRLILFLLLACWGFTALAQSDALKVYPIGERTYVGAADKPFERRNIRSLSEVKVVGSFVVLVGERGEVIRYLPPAEFLRADAQPWGASAAEAVGAFNGAFSAMKMDYVTVATYAAAVGQATGGGPKKIRVLVDADGLASIYEYWPDSTFPDKLERILTY